LNRSLKNCMFGSLQKKYTTPDQPTKMQLSGHASA
jgi:hypothetical protein